MVTKALICEVCRKAEAVGVVCGACGPVSYAICKSCLAFGAEPYGYLVAYVSLAGACPSNVNAYYQPIIARTCQRAGKTEEEFWRDVRELNEAHAAIDFAIEAEGQETVYFSKDKKDDDQR